MRIREQGHIKNPEKACPKCGSLDGFTFPKFYAKCVKCGILITRSEWRKLSKHR